MRITFVVASLALFLAAPLPVRADSVVAGVNECRRLTQQIGHFESMHARAEDLGNELWQERLEDHLGVLTKRRAENCPGYGPEEQMAQQLAILLKLAGQAALSYFTFGAF